MTQKTQIKASKRNFLTALLLPLAVVFAPGGAFAACSTPTGTAGDIIYNSSYNILQYCNGTNWINTGSVSSSGGALVAGDFCTTNGSLITCNIAYTGTGNVVLGVSPTIAAPTLTGTAAGASSTWSGSVAIGTTATSGALNVVGTVTATSFSGSGASLTGIGTSALGGFTGTPSSTTYLRGDSTWSPITSSQWTTASGNIYFNTGNVAIGTSTMNGALNVAGTVTATTFSGSGASLTGIGTAALGGITGTANSTTFLSGNGTWSALTTAALPALTNGSIWVGNGSNVAAPVAPAGDVTITNTGATTVAKIAGVAVGTPTGTGNVVMSASPTLSGTITGGTFSGTHTGNGSGLTSLTAANISGIIPTGNLGSGASGSGTYLRGDGTWATGGSGTVTSSGATNYMAKFTSASAVGSSLVYDSGTGVGFGTTSPAALMTVNGTAAFMLGADYTTTGSQADVAINTASTVRYNGAATATFYGLVAGTNGQIVLLHNASSYNLTLSNQSGSEATAANKIITGSGADLTMLANSSVILQYDTTASRWRVIGGSGGGATPAGATGQVQYNSGSNTLAATNNFTFLSASNALVVGTGAATPSATTGTVAGVTMNVIPQGMSFGSIGGTSGSIGLNAASTGQMAYYSGANAISGTSNLYVSGSNISIGTATTSSDSVSGTFLGITEPTGTSDEGIVLSRNTATSGYGNGMILFQNTANGAGNQNIAQVVGVTVGTSSNKGGMLQFRTKADTVANTGSQPTTRMTIDNAGYVGIGTTSPTQTLDVRGGGGIKATSSATYAAYLDLFSNNQSSNNIHMGQGFVSGTDNIGFLYNTANADYVFGTNNAERMRILAGGNVGIGATSPYQKFQVAGSGIFGASGMDPTPYSNTLSLLGASNTATSLFLWKNGQASAQIGFRGSTDQNLYILNSYSTGLISNSPGITIDTAGNVGIGTTPRFKLELNGSLINTTAYNGNSNLGGYDVGVGSVGANTLYGYTASCVGNATGTCSGAGGVVLGPTNLSANVDITTGGTIMSSGGSAIQIYFNYCGGPCGSYHAIGSWVNVGAIGYTWATGLNTNTSLFTHNGYGTITVNKAGLYHIRESLMMNPASDVAWIGYACPFINGGANCTGNDGLPHQRFGPNGSWYWDADDFYVPLGAGATIQYGYLIGYALNDWAHDGYTTLSVQLVN